MRNGFVLAVLLTATAAGAQTPVMRTLVASDAPITITTRVKFTTLVVLPAGEEVVDIGWGDLTGWGLKNATGTGMIHITPLEAGARTTAHLVTTSGAIYSLIVEEKKTEAPDLRVTITGNPKALPTMRKFYTEADLDGLRRQVTEKDAALAEARTVAARSVQTAKQDSEIRYPYDDIPNVPPFRITAARRNLTHTFFNSRASELPAIYELKDGKPALIPNFDVIPPKSPGEPATYVIGKLVDKGYFQIGNKKLYFQLRDPDAN